MEIEYTLRPEDFQAFDRYHRNFRKGRIQLSLLAMLELPAIIVLGLGIAIGLPLVWPTYGGGELILSLCGWYAGWMTAHLFQRRWQNRLMWGIYKEQCEDRRSSWAAQNVRVIVSATQLRTVSPMSETHYHWSVIWHIAETPNHVFLYTTRRKAIIIPRRAFRDAAHHEDFVALIRQYKQDSRGQEPKSTGIITSLPPDPTAITSQNAS